MIPSKLPTAKHAATENSEEAGASRSTFLRRAEEALRPDASTWTALCYAAIGLGCILRLLRWIDNPAFWLDEAFLAINLLDKSFGELLGQLHFLQSAPPGFLLVEKSAETLLGDAEWSLRLFPLIASVASVFLFAYIARRVLAAPAAALAIVLFAVGEPLLERAAEVKPYSVDLAAATLLLALALWVIAAPPQKILRRTAILGVAGLAALWFSFPAAFSLAAALTALAVYALEIGSRRLLVATAGIGALALAMFAGVYVVASSNVSRISARIFAGSGDESTSERLSIVQDSWSTFVSPGGFDNGTNALAAMLACFGALALVRRGALHVFALFTVPALLAFVAAWLDLYPLGGRFSLFLVPVLLVLVARGAQALVSWSRRPLVVSTGLALFLAASPAVIAIDRAVDPPAREDVRPLLEHVIREWRDGDVIYVYGNTQYALRYHTTCTDCSPSGDEFPWRFRLAPSSEPGDQFAPALESVSPSFIVGSTGPEGVEADLARLPRVGRVWLLFSHVRSHGRFNDQQVLVTELEHQAEPAVVVRARGADLYRFDLASPDD